MWLASSSGRKGRRTCVCRPSSLPWVRARDFSRTAGTAERAERRRSRQDSDTAAGDAQGTPHGTRAPHGRTSESVSRPPRTMRDCMRMSARLTVPRTRVDTDRSASNPVIVRGRRGGAKPRGQARRCGLVASGQRGQDGLDGRVAELLGPVRVREHHARVRHGVHAALISPAKAVSCAHTPAAIDLRARVSRKCRWTSRQHLSLWRARSEGNTNGGNTNALRALAPLPRAPVPRPSRPQPRTPPPAGAAGTAHISLRARRPRPPGCERDARRAHRCRQAANEPPGSAGTALRGGGTTAPAAPSQSRSGHGRGGAGARP